MAIRAGQAFIAISPSFRGFRTKTETWVKTNLRGVDIEVNPVMSKKPLMMRPPKPVTVPVDVDRSRFNRSLAAIESRLDRLTRGRFVVNVGIALSPIAAPALAAAVGGAVAGAGIGAAGLAGIVGMATVGAASLKRITAAQDEVTKSAAASAVATRGLQGAQESLASAERAAADARVAAARQVADASRAGARQVAAARTAAARQIAAAEDALVAAERRLADSQIRVGQGLADLHQARVQALLDLDDLRDKSGDNALATESAEIGLLEAQEELARVQKDVKSSTLDLRRAKLGVAEAEDRLSDARRQAAADAAELANAERGGTEANPGVIEARKALEDAKKAEAEARRESREAGREVARARADGRREVAQAKADARREVAEARSDAARQVADADRAVASAGAGLAAAQVAASQAQAAQAQALAAMSPAQKAAAAGMDRLKASFAGFQDTTDPFLLPALTKGMDALGKGLAPLAAFMAPVSVAAGNMFSIFGDAVASKGFMVWATAFGDFTAQIGADATQGILNLGRAFGNLFTAFMPLSTDMSSGLVVLTARFADWTAGLQGSAGFESFVSYVRENGPLLLSTLGQVGLAIIAVGKAAAPLGHDLLVLISNVAQFVAGFSAAHPQITSAVVGFVALSSGVSAAAGPLSKMIPLVKIASSGVLGLAKGTKSAVTFGAQFVGGLRNQSLALKNGATWATTFGSATRQGATNTLAAARTTGTFVLEQGRLALAYGRNVIASGLMTAGMLVQRATTIAITVATRAWAAGQWLLNAALTANPIGLVITALVALGAGLVLMYQKVDWFRAGVDALWSGIRWGYGWVKDNWGVLVAIVGGPLVLMYQKVGWFRDGVNALWSGIQAGFGWVKDNWGFLATIVAGPVGLIVANFDKIKSGVGKVADAFGAARDGIASVWGKLADAVANPLDTIKKALNVFFKGIDKIAEFFGLNFNFRFDLDEPKGRPSGAEGKDNTRPPSSAHYAAGGVLPGWSPGRDIHHFTSPTAGDLHLSGGESIMVPEWTAQRGGPAAVAAENRAARRGQMLVGGKPVPSVMNKMAMRGGQAFAGGGVFWPTKSKHWTTYAGHDGIDLNGPGNGLGDPYFATAAGRIRYTGAGRGYGNKVELDTSGGPTVIYGHSSSIAVKAGQQVQRGQVLGRIGYSGNVRPAGPAGSHLHFGLLGEPQDEGAMAVRYLAGAKMPSGGGDGGGSSFDPLGEIKSAITAAKKISDSIEAGPFGGMLRKAPSTLGGMGLDWAKKKLNPIDDIADGLSNLGIGGRGDTFDLGGIAAHRGVMVKDTMRPERVLSPAETSALQAGLRNLSHGASGPVELVGELEMVNGVAYIRGVAKQAIDEADSTFEQNMRFAQP